MAGKKIEKMKGKLVPAREKMASKHTDKDKKTIVRSKVVAKKSDKNVRSEARLSALEKARARAKTAVGKVIAKVTKAKDHPSTNAKKPTIIVKTPPKLDKNNKTVKTEKLAKTAKPHPKNKISKEEQGHIEKASKADSADLKKVVSAKSPVSNAPSTGKTLPTSKDKKSAENSGKKQLGSGKEREKCREPGCDLDALLSGNCRLHYIKNWRRIKKKESILSTGQLDGYVEELVAKYPDKYLDAIENDLASEKEWTKVITDLELGVTEEDFTADEDDSAIAETPGRRVGGFDDDGEDIY